jgi:CheY-like chemotaxis protein/anti-anti-sigma regulatory factor
MALKVLTVDDSKTIRMIVKKAFKDYDCEMFEAENGVEGLSIAAKEKPGLIVLDITMPVMNGVEMLEKLKGEPELKDTPVIMLTAESGKDNVMQIVKMGVKDYMVKPFKGEDLIGRVQKIMPLKPKLAAEPGENNGNKYFSQVEDIPVLALPTKVTRPVSVEVEGNLQAKFKEMAESQAKKMILDLCKVSETNVSLIKLIISTLQRCQSAKIAVRVVASSKQGEELKSFQETSGIPIVNTIEEAQAALG